MAPRPVDSSIDPSTGPATAPDGEARRDHFRTMLRSRRLEERLRSIYRQGKVVGGVYLGIGQEALSAAAGLQLRSGDVFAPLIRDSAGRLAAGESLQEVFRVYLGKATGSMRGRDGNVHRGDLDIGLLPMISHLGAMVPVVAGFLLSRRLRGSEGAIGIASIGDGGMNTGALHEGLNAAATLRLPLVLVVANNKYSYSTPNEQSFACANLADRAPGYGVPVLECDGTDPAATLATLQRASDRAREGGGTQMVVARLLRMSGHGEHDDARYVSEADRAANRDCLAVGRQQLLEESLLSEAELADWEAAIEAEIDAALATVEAEADPSPADERWSAYHGAWPFPPTRTA